MSDVSKKYVPQRTARGTWIAEVAGDGACVAVLAGICAAIFWRAVAQGGCLLLGSGEASAVSWPFFDYLHHRVHDLHQVPLWNPNMLCGTPFLGSSAGAVFSPINVVLLVEDSLRAYTFACILEVWLSGVSLYVFLRSIQIGRHAALTGGVWYMLSGMVVAHAADRAFLAAPLFLPLVFASLGLAFQRRSWAWVGTAALCWGLQGLAGSLQMDAIGAAAVLLLAMMIPKGAGPSSAAAAASEGKAGAPLRLAMTLVALIAGTAFAGAQLVPALDVLSQGDFPHAYRGMNYAPFGSLSALVAPGMIRDLTGLPLWIGTLGLLFAFLSVRLKAVPWVKFFWAIVVIAIGGLVVLRVPAVQAAASRLPHFDEVQHARALVLCAFALSALAAIRLDWTLQKERLDVERGFGLVVALFLAVVVGGLLLLRDRATGGAGLADRIVGQDWQAALIIGSASVLAALFWMGGGAVRWLVLPLVVVELALPAILGLQFTDGRPSRPKAGPRTEGAGVPVPPGYAAYEGMAEHDRGGELLRALVERRAYFPNVAVAAIGQSVAKKLERLEEGLARDPNTVLIEHDLPHGTLGPLSRETGSIEIKRHDPEEVELRVAPKDDRLLILADEYSPDWKATVDGREVTVHRVNLWMRAVPVPSGEHTVVFTYRPTAAMWGLGLSGAGLLAIAALWIASLRRPTVQPIG